jgi:prolipoprotein diacylglyceryltransferase
MNQRRRIFFYIFGVYHLFILFFVIYIESQKEDLSVLYGLYSKISLLKYGAVLGIMLFIIDFAWTWYESRNARKEHDILRHENNTLKAKVYDFQEAAKPVVKEIPGSGTK